MSDVNNQTDEVVVVNKLGCGRGGESGIKKSEPRNVEVQLEKELPAGCCNLHSNSVEDSTDSCCRGKH